MSDLPNLDAARAALEATLLPASTSTTYRAIGECGHDLGYSSPIDNYNRDRPLWCSDCGGYAGIDDVRAVEMVNHADMSVDAAFLRDALAAVDALTARLAEAEANGRRKGLEEAAQIAEVRGWHLDMDQRLEHERTVRAIRAEVLR